MLDSRLSIAALFQAQAALHPDRPALKVGDRVISYAELDRQSNRLAHAILNHLGPENLPVALLIPHGAEMITALLATFKAGKVAVPLDASVAVDRVRFVLAHSECAVVLVDESQREVAAELGAPYEQIFGIEQGADFSEAPPDLCVAAEALAAIFYTSGSTGRPKGVLHTHRSIVANLSDMSRRTEINPEDRATGLYTFNSTTAVAESLHALLNGACLLPFDVRRDGIAALADWLLQEQVTIFQWFPSGFRRFAETLEPEFCFPHIRRLLFASEPLTRTEIEFFRRHFPVHCRLINRMGSTETGALSALMLERATPLTSDAVPAGYPVPGAVVTLVNEDGAPAGSGEPGIIRVASPAVAQGYWRDPELTAQVFSDAPGQPGIRAYITGDMGRFSADGCLENLGRKDRQIKIRGYRVEPAEVETALRELPDVREAVALARQDPRGQQHLIAYLTAASGEQLPLAGIRQILANRLPSYLVPTRLMQVAAIPVAATGKIDAARLPAPDWDEPDTADSQVETPLEALVARIWSEVLHVERIGRHTDYYSLGGDSLRAALVANRLQGALGATVTPVMVLQDPTVERLAASLTERCPDAVTRYTTEAQPTPAEVIGRSASNVLVSLPNGSKLAEWLQLLDGSAQPLELPTPPLRLPDAACPEHAVLAPLCLAQSPLSGTASERNLQLLAGLATLLHRYTEQDRFSLGLLDLSATGELLLPIPVDFRDNPAFSGVVAQVGEGRDAAHARGGIPLAEVVATPEWQQDSLPSFLQVLVRLERGSTPAQAPATPFDLLITLDAEAVSIWIGSARVDPSLCARLPGHLATLLNAASTEPDTSVGALPLLTPEERRQIVEAWGCGSERPRVQDCVHQVIERKVAEHPERTAIRFEDEAFSYAELNRRANRLAHWLRQQGAGPGKCVGLFFQQNPDAVVAVLAVLKSGAAYAGLPLADPVERLEFILQDTEPLLVLTHSWLGSRLPATAPSVFYVDQHTATLEAQPDTNPAQLTTPDDAAFILYTSGSTGPPKAVVGTHRGLVNRGHWWADHFPPREVPNVECLRASVGVLPFLRQLFQPLSAGSTLVVTADQDSTDASRFVDLVARHGIAHVVCNSSLLVTILDIIPDLHERLPLVESWQCGAEVLPPEHALLFRKLLPGRRLLLMYGSTETSTGVASLDTAELTPQHFRIPVGRPIPNCQIYVFDRYRQPVPAGVRGEVYVGGECLTRGYLNRPELTAERFVPNPLPEGRSARLYRMGDLGRFLPDGNLELLGRADHQVKIRGFRVELAEVEAALIRHPLVREAVVVVRDFGGDSRLVAYLAPAAGSRLSLRDLRQFVGEALPGYMVPALFQLLPALPRMPSGKVNRRALPDPDLAHTPPEAVFSTPQGETEARLARIWEEVLCLQPVGRDDDFFDLGGHSLLVMRVLSRIRENFQTELGASDLFEHRTLAALAKLLPSLPTLAGGSALPPGRLEPLAPGEPMPLSFAQQRLWFLDQLERDSSAFNEPTFLRFRGELDIGCLERALDEVVRRHSALRACFPTTDGEPHQTISAPAHLPLPLTDLINDPDAEPSGRLRALLPAETGTPFQLATGPILRARLFRLSPTEHLFSLVIHHVATDGWSANLFIDELRQLYRAYQAHQPSPLPELTCQYADFAAWQRREADFTPELAYWTQRLENAPKLELPLDFPRPLMPRHEGALAQLNLGRELTQTIERLAREEKATPFMVLLATFAVVLGRWTGAEDLVIGAPVVDRPFPETEGLIGLFLNNLSLRVDLSGGPSFRQLLARVRTTAVEAYAHQRVPFERVVEALHVERDTTRHPVFEVMCNHLSAPQASLDFPDLTVTRVQSEVPAAKLPMTLYSRFIDGALTLRLVYQDSLFRPERMDAFLEQFRWLLTQVSADPEASLDTLSLVTPGALAVLSDPTAELHAPSLLTVIEELHARATDSPEAPAVAWKGRSWSYRELVAASERVAVSMAGRVPPGAVVAVTGERSFGLIAAILGVLRAGAVLLTLDPALPPARQALMASEAGCRLLINVGAELTHELGGIEALTLDPTDPAINARRGADLPLPDRGAAAYVFFTSGSTGNPKAVLGTHTGLAHFVAWQRQAFDVQRGDRCAQLTGLSFDVLLRDLFLPLTSGAALCLPEISDLATGPTVFGWLEREAISTLHAVPSLTRHWLATPVGTYTLPRLRFVFLAGEPLRDDLVHWWKQSILSPAVLVNLYGPTETTLAKFCYAVPAAPEPGLQPVGWPLPQTQALVLSTPGTRCGLYEPGEVVIRTPYRTRGYLNSPEETQGRFRPNPHRSAGDDLLYYTGDRGYLRPDGALVVLGRIDAQFKVRGVRIEPGEIEAALRRHPAVQEAAVDLRRGPSDADVLAAYVVSLSEDATLFPDLSRFLMAHLPAALVPATFTRVAQLPRNTNGKLLRASLPEPVFAAPERSEPVAPRDDVERRLAGIWQDLLGRREVGIQDNFFDLGGHSLLAVQLLGRIQRAFGRELPLASLIQSATIAEIAERLRDGAEIPAASVLVPLQPGGSRPPLFAVHGIGGGVLCYRALSQLLGLDQPFYALQAPALAGEAAVHLSLEEMAERYVSAVRRVQPAGPYHLIGLSFGGNIALEMAQQLVRAGEQVAFLGMLDSKGPGYPRFPGRATRYQAHLRYFWSQTTQGRRHYLAVRLQGARDQIRRRLLRRWFQWGQRAKGALPHVLDDIGISHIQAAREYRRQPFPGTITLFQASMQPIGCIAEWDNGWSRVAQEGVIVYPVPGEHAEIVEEPYVRVLAEHLATALRAEPTAAKPDIRAGLPVGC